MTTPIIGIPTTRISDLFIRERLLNQVQYDQAEIFRVMTQVSTGRRFEVPSEDPVAAMRVMSLQRLLERKDQMGTNLATNQSFLAATDTALSSVSNLLAEARGIAISVLGTTATDLQRETAAQQVDQIVGQLLDTGNQQFRGRYLFAGSKTTVRPFEDVAADLVEYSGNQTRLSSYADIGQLFDTNLTGSEVFGAISAVVQGSTDLTPVLTYNTRLADLRGGLGISRGSIAISDGTETSIVDVSQAETIGDLAAMIKAHPPEGRTLQVEITAKTIVIRIDPMVGVPTNLSIREVGGGKTAGELGILRVNGVGEAPIVGSDLDPVLRPTTPLTDILGVRASAVVHSTGEDNDFVLQADALGTALADGTPLNGVSLSFVDDPLVTVGHEWVAYSGGTTLVVHIDAEYTRASHVVQAIHDAHQAGTLPFDAQLDPLDDVHGGQGLVDVHATATTAGGEGTSFDKTSGLQIVNRGESFTIDLSTAQTIEDVLNLINGSGAGVLAEINQAHSGIDLRSRVSGCDFTIGENGGTTATQLGLRTFTSATLLEDLNFGIGVHDWPGYTGTDPTATYSSPGNNNKLIFRAENKSLDWNDFTIRFVDTTGTPGMTFDLARKTMQFDIRAGVTTANDVLQLFRSGPAAAQTAFELSLGANDDGTTNNGTGLVAVGSATTAGGDDSGIDFYVTRADGVRLAIDVSGAQTIGDILAKINDNIRNVDGALVARLARYGNGIELVDNSLGGGPLAVQRNPQSTAAIDLGLVPPGAETSSPATQQGTATTMVSSASVRNNLIFSARAVGDRYNGVRVIFQPGAPAAPAYSEASKTLVFGIAPGVTTAADIVAALGASGLSSLFSAAYDPADVTPNTGLGSVAATDPADPPTTGGGSAGSYASAAVASAGYDNGLIFTARHVGTAYNDIKIVFQSVPEQPAAVLSYDPVVAKELVFGIDPGITTAQDIIAALQAHAGANADFAAALDPDDYRPNDGSGLVDATASVPSAAAKSDLIFTVNDLATMPKGLRVIFASGAPTAPVYDEIAGTLTFGITPGVTTAADIIAALAAEPELAALFPASLNPNDTSGNDGSGLVADLSGPVLGGGGAGTCAAAQVTFAGLDNDLIIRAKASGAALNGTNVVFVAGGALTITHAPGTLTVTYPPGTTAQQVVAAFAGNAEFVVTLDSADASPNDGSGVVDATQAALAPLAGGSQTLTGTDVDPQETEGVFTALLRIRSGLESNDVRQVQRAIDLLDRTVIDMTFARAELATRQQGLDMLKDRQDAEDVELRQVLSDEYDVSLEQVLSELATRQAAFQASLIAAGRIFQMSLLNYL